MNGITRASLMVRPRSVCRSARPSTVLAGACAQGGDSEANKSGCGCGCGCVCASVRHIEKATTCVCECVFCVFVSTENSKTTGKVTYAFGCERAYVCLNAKRERPWRV